MPDLETGEVFDIPIFRFYFDGLIVHFHRPPLHDQRTPQGALVVGHGEKLVISTVKFRASWQSENLALVTDEAELAFPGEIDRALGVRAKED